MITPCDVLILDEPTNHLDSEMADWLENKLQAFRGALVMVTHDRYFLDSVTNKIIELDKGKIYSYDEKYSGVSAAKGRAGKKVCVPVRENVRVFCARRLSGFRVVPELVRRNRRHTSSDTKH